MIAKNNPGNIRYNPSIPGVIGNEKGFSVFASLADGIKGIQYILEKYYLNSGFNTIRKIGYKYAPPSENNTEKWIEIVSSISGISPDQSITPSNLPELLMAIIRIETGTRFSISEIQRFLKNNSIGLVLLIGSAIFGLWIFSDTKKGEPKF